MAATARPRVFLDLQVGTEPAGRLVIELFVDKTPKTCENFHALCTGELGQGLTYKNSPFHRIIDEFMVQGGDITKGDGTGGETIYGAEFEDENIGWREIDKEGLVCMANRGKGTNSSQFFITLAPCPHLNAKHTVFGTVVSGQPVLDRIARLKVDKNDRPYDPVLIAHCGGLERRKKPTTQSTVKETFVKASKGTPSRRRRSSSSEDGDRGRKRRRGESDVGSDGVRHYKRPPHRKDHTRSRQSRSRSPQQSRDRYRKRSPSRSRSLHRKHRRRSPSHDSNLRGRSPIRSASRTSSPPLLPSTRKARLSEPGRTRSPTPPPRHQRSRSPHHLHRRRTRSPSPSPPRRRYRSRSRSHSPGSFSEDRHRRRYARDHRPHRHHDYRSWRSDHYSSSYYDNQRPDEDRIRRKEVEREGLSGRYEGVIAEDEDGRVDRGKGDRWNRSGRRGYVDREGSGRLGGGADGGGDGEVKFKGRGSMKYRERRW